MLTEVTIEKGRDKPRFREGARKTPTASQLKWLARGLAQAGGKLPLFDEDGQRISGRTIQTCIENAWAEPWFANPMMQGWQICKLTAAGRTVLSGA